mmetsp:Transcript_8295/g.23352  ORF Transcript_8295/g.23352 Transcript_8295/m.23352 type:complete len:158 (+) Transcript_8295:73-546(+)
MGRCRLRWRALAAACMHLALGVVRGPAPAAPAAGAPCRGKPCVMQNRVAGVCYEGDEAYLAKCVRKGAAFNRDMPDAAISFSKLADGPCDTLGYPMSLERYSSVVYDNVTGHATAVAFALLFPALELMVRNPSAASKLMTPAQGYPAGCKYFGEVIG